MIVVPGRKDDNGSKTYVDWEATLSCFLQLAFSVSSFIFPPSSFLLILHPSSFLFGRDDETRTRKSTD